MIFKPDGKFPAGLFFAWRTVHCRISLRGLRSFSAFYGAHLFAKPAFQTSLSAHHRCRKIRLPAMHLIIFYIRAYIKKYLQRRLKVFQSGLCASEFSSVNLQSCINFTSENLLFLAQNSKKIVYFIKP